MLIARILAGLVGAYFAFLALKDFLVLLYRFDLIALGIGGVAGLIAAFLLWFAALADDPRERKCMAWTLLIGGGIGLICFLAGFIGPLIFAPEANQGLLLGIFITGPLGFLAGCAIGFVWTRMRVA